MSLYSAIKSFIARRPVSAAIIGSNSQPPVLGTENFLQTYDNSPLVRSMAGKVAGCVGETKWKLIRTDIDTEVTDHLMLRTLRRPNPLLTGTALIRVTQLSLDLVGDAFWFLERNGLGAPVAFWPLPPHWIAELPTARNETFRVSHESWQARIPEREIIWIHDASPYNPYGRGHGIIQALADEVSGDEYAAKHVNQLFFNRAMPEIVVQDFDASPEQINQLERGWNNRLRGMYRAMRPYFTNRKLELWQPQQQTLENLTLVPLRQFERDIQLQTWGIPPEQLGIVKDSNRATAEASDFIFESRVIRPRRQFLADELTMKLAVQYDERLELQFVDTSPRDKEHALKVMTAGPAAFTVDEWRASAGLEPIEGGDARIVPLNVYLTDDPIDNDTRPNQPGAAANMGFTS